MLDVFVIDSEHNNISCTKTDAPFIAGHDCVQLEYAFDVRALESHTVTRRVFKRLDDAAFLLSIHACFSDSVIFPRLEVACTADLDAVLESFYDVFKTALDIHAPFRTFCASKPPSPWYTGEFTDRLREQPRLFKQAKRSACALG